MTLKPDGERLATLEAQTQNITEKVNNIESSMQALHGKFDLLNKVIAENYVAKDTLEQLKQTLLEKEKNKVLERLLWIVTTTIITSIIAFYLNTTLA
jgi:septal ring factor EnvC (AmiA/AmiB activator)